MLIVKQMKYFNMRRVELLIWASAVWSWINPIFSWFMTLIFLVTPSLGQRHRTYDHWLPGVWPAHKSGPTDLCADLQICIRENECFWWNSLTSPLNLSELLHRYSCRFQIYKSTNGLLHRFSCRFQIYKTTIWLLHRFNRFADLQSWKRIHSHYGGREGQKYTNKSS